MKSKKNVILVFLICLLLFALCCRAAEAPEQPQTPVCEHVFTETAVPPTQDAPGYTERVCEKCGAREKEETAPAEGSRAESALLGDVNGNGAVTTDDARTLLRAAISLAPLKTKMLPYADLNADGNVTVSDARLALRIALSLDSAPARHQYKTKTEKAATCTETGAVSFRCVYCGEAGSMTAPALGHKFGKAAVAPSTCIQKGTRTRACKTCGFEETVSLPLADHGYTLQGDVVSCGVCGFKAQGFTQVGKNTYYCEKGKFRKSWTGIDGKYYFFDRASGAMRAGCMIDGIRLDASGNPPQDDYTTEKIRTFIKAKKIVASITDPSDSVAVKKEKAFRWVMKFPYRQYRGVGEAMRTPGFEMLFANDIFDRGNGCCGSASYAFAFLAVECGCKEVFVADDGVRAGGHAWVTMEGNNNVYDIVFAKAKSFSKNYNYPTSDYRRCAPRKTYIGG